MRPDPGAGLPRQAVLFPPPTAKPCLFSACIAFTCFWSFLADKTKNHFPACVACSHRGTNTAAPFPVSCFHLFRLSTSLFCWQTIWLHKQCKTKPLAGVGPASIITGSSLLLVVGRQREPPFTWSRLAGLWLQKGSGHRSTGNMRRLLSHSCTSSLLPIA